MNIDIQTTNYSSRMFCCCTFSIICFQFVSTAKQEVPKLGSLDDFQHISANQERFLLACHQSEVLPLEKVNFDAKYGFLDSFSFPNVYMLNVYFVMRKKQEHIFILNVRRFSRFAYWNRDSGIGRNSIFVIPLCTKCRTTSTFDSLLLMPYN